MLKADQIKSLNQKNQSVDAQKTKEHLKAAWQPLDAKARAEVLKLCGLSKFAIQKSCSTGVVSAKTICAIAQVAKINPYYLTGESDEQNCDFTDETLPEFLRGKNLTVSKKGAKAKVGKDVKTVKAAPAETSKGRAGKAVSASAPKAKKQIESSGDSENALDELGRFANELFASLPNAKKDKIEKISAEELSVLLSGLVTRARINGDSGNLLKLVKYILSR